MSCVDHSPCRFIHLQKGLDNQRKLILDDVQITGHGCGEEIQTHNELGLKYTQACAQYSNESTLTC